MYVKPKLRVAVTELFHMWWFTCGPPHRKLLSPSSTTGTYRAFHTAISSFSHRELQRHISFFKLSTWQRLATKVPSRVPEAGRKIQTENKEEKLLGVNWGTATDGSPHFSALFKGIRGHTLISETKPQTFCEYVIVQFSTKDSSLRLRSASRYFAFSLTCTELNCNECPCSYVYTVYPFLSLAVSLNILYYHLYFVSVTDKTAGTRSLNVRGTEILIRPLTVE